MTTQTAKTIRTALKAARVAVNAQTFGTPEWEAAMTKVRALVAELDAIEPPAALPSGTFLMVERSGRRARLVKGETP